MARKKTDRFTGIELHKGPGEYDITDHHVIGKKIGGVKYGTIAVVRGGHQDLHRYLNNTIIKASERDRKVDTELKTMGTVDIIFTGGKAMIGEDGHTTIEKNGEVLGLLGSFVGFKSGDLTVTGTHSTGLELSGQPGQKVHYAMATRKGEK